MTYEVTYALKCLLFSYRRKLILGSRNHGKIWVCGKLGYEGPRDFEIGANCAEWPCLYTTYEAICTLKCSFFELLREKTRDNLHKIEQNWLN